MLNHVTPDLLADTPVFDEFVAHALAGLEAELDADVVPGTLVLAEKVECIWRGEGDERILVEVWPPGAVTPDLYRMRWTFQAVPRG